MINKIKKLKILRKFNIKTIYELTSKINILVKKTKYIIKDYKLPKNIKLLKLIYDIKIKKLKYHFNKFIFLNLYNFLKTLKSRLDFILFNFNFFLTINQAKQSISHKHIFINNKIAKKSSYCVKNNDIIHICGLSNSIIIKRLIYSYIIRNLTLYKISKKKIIKATKLRNKIKKTILKLNTEYLNNITCNKNFKIKINKNIK